MGRHLLKKIMKWTPDYFMRFELSRKMLEKGLISYDEYDKLTALKPPNFLSPLYADLLPDLRQNHLICSYRKEGKSQWLLQKLTQDRGQHTRKSGCLRKTSTDNLDQKKEPWREAV